MLDGKILARARDRLAQRREENEALRAKRAAEVNARIPALRETDARLRALMGEVIRLATEPNAAPALREIGARSQALCEERERLLTQHGLPPDYLEDVVSCKRCNDTGYTRTGAVCDCLLKLYEEERARELSAALKLGDESFADFDLSLYPAGPARDCMELTMNTCKRYAINFGPYSPNLLFQGGTGLGKTFLSGCVAKTVSGLGHSVAYETAQGAFAAFEDQKFSRDAAAYEAASERVRRILNCELLILDDLGTELTTSFTQSALYNILNTRVTAPGCKTIVSTNLSDEELAARYLPQTVSRLSGEFDTLLFMGRDIRAIRKERRYL